MDDLADLYLGHTTIKYKEVTGTGKSQVTFDQVPLEKALDYAAEDADITLRLHQALKPRLLEEHLTTAYETLERPLIPVLAAMEQKGIKVDMAQLKQVSQEFSLRLLTLEQEIHRLAGKTFNVGSPKQLGEVLFDDLKMEGGKKGKAGSYATGVDVLESLAAQGHELPEKVLEWRHLDKLRSTYAEALIHQINPQTHQSAYLVCHGLSRDGTIILNRSESPEHSDPNGRRPKNSSGLCGRTRMSDSCLWIIPKSNYDC